MRPTFDLLLLRSFVVVANLKSVSRAADLLHRVQPAISQQIHRLEQLAGGKLFQREKNHFELTALGQKLYPMATRLLSLNDTIVAQLQSIDTERHITIGTSEVYASGWLAQIMGKFHACFEAHPVRTTLICDYSPAIWQRFEQGDLDIVITQCRPDTIRGETLCVEPVVWIAAAGSTAHRQRPVPLALFGDGCTDRSSVLKCLRDSNLDYEVVAQSTHLAGVLAPVCAGLAVTALPQSAADSVTMVGLAQGLPKLDQVSISIATRSDSSDPYIDKFQQISRLHFQQMTGQARTIGRLNTAAAP